MFSKIKIQITDDEEDILLRSIDRRIYHSMPSYWFDKASNLQYPVYTQEYDAILTKINVIAPWGDVYFYYLNSVN